MNGVVLVADRLWRGALVSRLLLGCRPVLVRSSNVKGVVAASATVPLRCTSDRRGVFVSRSKQASKQERGGWGGRPRKRVCTEDTAHDVAEMWDVVDIRQRGRDQDVSFALDGKDGRFRLFLHCCALCWALVDAITLF